jgi:hypothetical protein
VTDLEDSGFHQQYDISNPKGKQKVHIYCRMCRNCFPVAIITNPRAKVRCTCGHKGRLLEFDVFTSPERAKDFADFYGRIICAVKDTLRDNNIPLPPSGRFMPYRKGFAEDESDIRFSYVESESETIPDSYGARARLLHTRLQATREDLIDYHEVLSQLIEWSYSHRVTAIEARADCYRICREDIELVPRIIRESKKRAAMGKKVRLSFASFKHLAILLEEDEEFAEALAISQRAKKLGLKGYNERIRRLQDLV